MFFLPVTVVLIALIIGILGIGGASGVAVGIAKLLFFISMVLLLIASLLGRKTPFR